MGVYDRKARKGLGMVRVQAKEMPGDAYRRIVYVAPDDNESNVKGVYTDRIELVPVTK